jgi:septal ring factor EnvC (AmiA/AmiB activator)
MGIYNTVENHEDRLNQLTEEVSKLSGHKIAPAKETPAPAQENPKLDQHDKEIGEIRSELTAMYDVFAKLGDRIGSLEDAKAAHEMEIAGIKKSTDKNLTEVKKALADADTNVKKALAASEASVKKSLAASEAAYNTATTRTSSPEKVTATSNGPSGGSGQAKGK